MLPNRVLEDARLGTGPDDDGSDGGSASLDPLAAEIRGLSTRDAVDLCARRLGRPLGRTCFALLGSRAEADETVQETFLVAARTLSSFRGDGTLRGWLFCIARRICAHRLETRTYRAGRLHLVQGEAPSEPPRPDDALDARDLGHRVRAALAELRPSEREVLLLRYDAGLGFREVAQACGIDEVAARKRASRALHRLRQLLPIEDLR